MFFFWSAAVADGRSPTPLLSWRFRSLFIAILMTTAPQPQSKRRRASRRRRNAASRVVFDWLSLLLLLLLLLLLFLYTKGRSAVEWEWRFHSLAGNRRNGATDNKGGPRLRSVNLDLDWSTNVKTSNLNSCSSVPWNSFQAISSHCTSFPKERPARKKELEKKTRLTTR